MIVSIMAVSSVFAAQGAIWTTKDDCGDSSQDENHYAIGDHVFINGDNFDSLTEYNWDITGKPGGASCDPNSVVASGSKVTESDGTFCFDAYTVANDDCGEYHADFGGKGDNYRVDVIVQEPECGNGVVENEEECDDGNDVAGDGCTECTLDPFCGDGEVNQEFEQCDDGNNDNGDGCSERCQEEIDEIPEFTTIGAGLALAGAGAYLYRRRSRK